MKKVFSRVCVSFVVCFLFVFCLFCSFFLYRLVEVTDRFSLFIHDPGTMVGNEYCCFDNETCARYSETCCKRRRRPPKQRLTQLFCFCYFFEPSLLLLPLFRLLLVPTVGVPPTATCSYYIFCWQCCGGHGRQCGSLCVVERSDLHWVEERFQIATGDDHLGAEVIGEQCKGGKRGG